MTAQTSREEEAMKQLDALFKKLETKPVRKPFFAALGTALLTVLLLVISMAAVVMLLLGAAHAQDARIPALGFKATFISILALNLSLFGAKSKR